MAAWSNFAGTVTGFFRLGLTGVRLKDSAGVLAVRNAADTADAQLQIAAGTATNHAVTKEQLGVELSTVTATVASDALTLGSAVEYLDFRSATLASGTTSTVRAAPANIVVPSGATLGTANAVESQLYLIVMNNAGTAELAVMNSSSAKGLNESRLITTTILDAASDSKDVAYSAAARTDLPFRIIGKVTSTQATAGLWATAPSSIQGVGGLVIPKRLLQNLNVTTGALATGTALIPFDDTIPQITEGDQYMSLAITPTSSTSMLEVDVYIYLANNALNRMTAALFRDATANAVAVQGMTLTSANYSLFLSLKYMVVAGSVAETTFRVRAGGNVAGTTSFNGHDAARMYGGVIASSITIKEYAA